MFDGYRTIKNYKGCLFLAGLKQGTSQICLWPLSHSTGAIQVKGLVQGYYSGLKHLKSCQDQALNQQHSSQRCMSLTTEIFSQNEMT